ncbi:MAG: hypothetical protein ACR2PS_05680 [Pseudomonadales bacterium]
MHTIGTGQLNWPRCERIGDRYGAIRLYQNASPNIDGDPGEPMDIDSILGKRGKLVATVLETRESEHIGDFFHGFFPTTPDIGEVIEFGDGEFFKETIDGIEYIGLRPADGRNAFWMNPESLYRAHQQTVRLDFEG